MRPRIFIDFTRVDYRTHVTGIPRVAYAYLEEGYKRSRSGGFQVLPVYVRNGALIDARPFLIGSNWRRVRASPTPAAILQLLRSASYFVLHGARIILVTPFVPLLALLNFLFAYSFFDFWAKYMAAGFGAVYGALRD
ncbi:MAG: hypothetical protein ACREF4_17010, partial [Gammaproteobacteria bacterium]